jgi:hypothetical protein
MDEDESCARQRHAHRQLRHAVRLARDDRFGSQFSHSTVCPQFSLALSFEAALLYMVADSFGFPVLCIYT